MRFPFKCYYFVLATNINFDNWRLSLITWSPKGNLEKIELGALLERIFNQLFTLYNCLLYKCPLVQNKLITDRLSPGKCHVVFS